MGMESRSFPETKPTHAWLRKIRIACVPGAPSAILDELLARLMACFRENGHTVLERPEGKLDILITTAALNQPVPWREALFFTARRRYGLESAPTVFTAINLTAGQFQDLQDHFRAALAREQPDPADYAFVGLAPHAYHTLHEQGLRNGPILSIARLLQSQTMCIRILLVVGDDRPDEVYVFDLVGAHPRIPVKEEGGFYEDLMNRLLTAVSTHEITHHEVLPDLIPRAVWEALPTPAAMRRAGLELGKRQFFTEMVRVGNLVSVPTLDGAIASQYSEGCFATWEPKLGALITTVTGSARPVEKDNLSDDELAVIAGVRVDGSGAIVRHVQGKRNDPPSSEAVEMMQMDRALPRIRLGEEWRIPGEAPVARSKLHGHRGVRSFDPRTVEHVALDAPYYHYPVSCSTEAQANAIQAAFGRSQALTDPEDPREIVFSVLPGHGIVIVEKWVSGKQPFQAIWEAMDAGTLEVVSQVPQGPLAYLPDKTGRMVLVKGSE